MAEAPNTGYEESKNVDRTDTFMLLIALTVLGIVWLAVVVIVFALCASAAIGDRDLLRSTRRDDSPGTEAVPPLLMV